GSGSNSSSNNSSSSSSSNSSSINSSSSSSSSSSSNSDEAHELFSRLCPWENTRVAPVGIEMTIPPTPLTAIAQTPRKELESKFTFNPLLAKVSKSYS
ncbi:AF4/FMR2 family member lilli-like isoform X1, partial [Vespula squamosa]